MTKFLTKLTKLEQEINHPAVKRQVEEIALIDSYVQAGKPLKRAPRRLGLLPDEFEEVLVEVGPDKEGALRDLNNLLNNFRQYLSLIYGIWSLPNIQTAQLIKNKLHVQTALEIMAGNAYWSQALAQVGTLAPTTTPIVAMAPTTAPRSSYTIRPPT